ncbi:hypothetical protein Ciccas_005066 [Cichlidogyrus casuarinus]|uniref:Uncharacterized protein n=1 Tax=Cichlidogyrus casuarinus TaxID=1844966 RepID=A0ABD2Q9Q0_9PLAT
MVSIDVKSLENKQYDHLTATYLLLGERLRPHRRSLPQTLTANDGERILRLSAANHCSIGGQVSTTRCRRIVDFKREPDMLKQQSKQLKLSQLSSAQKQLLDCANIVKRGSHFEIGSGKESPSGQYNSLTNRMSVMGREELSIRRKLMNAVPNELTYDQGYYVDTTSVPIEVAPSPPRLSTGKRLTLDMKSRLQPEQTRAQVNLRIFYHMTS